MRIAVTGLTGQVVSALIERGRRSGHEVIALGRPQLDLLDPASVKFGLKAVIPDAIVSAAAYTAVDRAQGDVCRAYAINCEGAGSVARAAREQGVPLVHLSTDYVFDGSLKRPYVEVDKTRPTGIYGCSKLAGERAVLSQYGDNSAILRVAWVYSPFSKNFVKTLLGLARFRDEVSVVADQTGNPTSAFDIADGIVEVVRNLTRSDKPAFRGVFHMTAQGETSWAELAKATFKFSALQGGPVARVKQITTADYPTLAQRPANSRLDCGLIARSHGVVLPDWRSSLESVVARLTAIPV